jgi:hypothetical protein
MQIKLSHVGCWLFGDLRRGSSEHPRIRETGSRNRDVGYSKSGDCLAPRSSGLTSAPASAANDAVDGAPHGI